MEIPSPVLALKRDEEDALTLTEVPKELLPPRSDFASRGRLGRLLRESPDAGTPNSDLCEEADEWPDPLMMRSSPKTVNSLILADLLEPERLEERGFPTEEREEPLEGGFTMMSSPNIVKGARLGFCFAADTDSRLPLTEDDALWTEVTLPLPNSDDRTLDRLPELDREPGMPDDVGRGKPACSKYIWTEDTSSG